MPSKKRNREKVEKVYEQKEGTALETGMYEREAVLILDKDTEVIHFLTKMLVVLPKNWSLEVMTKDNVKHTFSQADVNYFEVSGIMKGKELK